MWVGVWRSKCTLQLCSIQPMRYSESKQVRLTHNESNVLCPRSREKRINAANVFPTTPRIAKMV